METNNKLREALGKIRAELWNNTIIAGKRKFELYEIADAALAAPPRNCDRPECATLEMATKTWIQEEIGSLCNNSKATMADVRTFDVWIYDHASEK